VSVVKIGAVKIGVVKIGAVKIGIVKIGTVKIGAVKTTFLWSINEFLSAHSTPILRFGRNSI
jgi:hypothetical protein